jgi:hypothetical protein
MIPYKSHRPMAVPNTLEARLEILKAISFPHVARSRTEIRRQPAAGGSG